MPLLMTGNALTSRFFWTVLLAGNGLCFCARYAYLCLCVLHSSVIV